MSVGIDQWPVPRTAEACQARIDGLTGSLRHCYAAQDIAHLEAHIAWVRSYAPADTAEAVQARAADLRACASRLREIGGDAKDVVGLEARAGALFTHPQSTAATTAGSGLVKPSPAQNPETQSAPPGTSADTASAAAASWNDVVASLNRQNGYRSAIEPLNVPALKAAMMAAVPARYRAALEGWAEAVAAVNLENGFAAKHLAFASAGDTGAAAPWAAIAASVNSEAGLPSRPLKHRNGPPP